MPIPSHIMGAGMSPLATSAISGGGRAGLVAVGTNQATALQLSSTFSQITTSSSSTGVKLQKIETGALIYIRNDSGQTITIYPFETTGVTINGSASITVATAKAILLFAPSETQWFSILTA